MDIEVNPFGLPLPDGSTSITYYPQVGKAMTGSQESGGHDNLTSDTPDYFYRTDPVQMFGPEGFSEWLQVRVVFKRTRFSHPDEFLGLLHHIVVELSDLEKDLTLDVLAGDPQNPMSWRRICDRDGKPFNFKYDAATRSVRSGKKVVAKIPSPFGTSKAAPAKGKRKKK